MSSDDQRVIKETIEGVLSHFPAASTENARDEAEKSTAESGAGGQDQSATPTYAILRRRQERVETERRAARAEKERADRLQVRRSFVLDFQCLFS